MSMKRNFRIVLCLALCLLLCGCGAGGKSEIKEIAFSSGLSFSPDAEEIATVVTAEELHLLDGFSQLRTADLSGSTCYAEMADWQKSHPGVELRYTVPLAGETVDSQAISLDLSGLDDAGLAEALPLLAGLPKLETVELGSRRPEEVQPFTAAYPQITFNSALTLLGKPVDVEAGTLDLSGAGHKDAEEILSCLPLFKALNIIELGSDKAEGHFEWDDIYAFHQACPEAELRYSFTLYGQDFTLADTAMDLNHTEIDDEGALVKKVTACMKNLEYLDMDFCGVSDESMAEIRDALPNTDVVWRIWFGEKYSVRTDVERILASNPGMGGDLTKENTESLKYCTKVKYLDLGHNNTLDTIDFVSYMPDLEVAILAMARWSDARPLANCPKLDYLELQTTALGDLRPLSGLKNLRHLNICYCFSLHDISPLYELTQLERLWIGKFTPVPAEQVAEMQEHAPDCLINTTTIDPTDGYWRFGEETATGRPPHPRYALLTEQFEYYREMEAYSYYFNDPLY